ncbi:MAG: hypothetical protein QOH99_567 [Frankiaceae bacterium]|nr:hypothetical protein [Frankiaceae bacterium]
MTSTHADWLAAESRRLIDFARGSLHPAGGFAFLDERGLPELDKPVETWLTGRMTHVFALGSLLGEPDCDRFVDHGVAALLGRLRDATNGGWHSGVDSTGAASSARKETYQHAFVVLAASSALAAGRPRAAELLGLALADLDIHFWDRAQAAHAESFATDWSDPEAYRGANSNMHTVEALMAASDATGDPQWRERALAIADRVVNDVTRAHDWRLVEHFDEHWNALPDYNLDNKADQFRPYGLTIGHWLEWSRLLLHLEAGLDNPPSWLAEGARALFDNALAQGWSVDGADGFVYTIDWSGAPVVRERMHWVVTEGIAAAAAMSARFGEQRDADTYNMLWVYAERYLIDREHGSWHHELDPHNVPAATVWPGKPDIYHALQCVLTPRLPLVPALSVALGAGELDMVTPPRGPVGAS